MQWVGESSTSAWKPSWSGDGLWKAGRRNWRRGLSGWQWHETAREVSPVPARLALGTTMTYHGATKLAPGGIEKTAQFFESVGIRPGRTWAAAVGLTETLAGICLLAGIATRPAALGVLVTQAVAIAKVHKDKGFRVEEGGYEFNLALMGIALGHLVAGPGKVSAHWGVKKALRRKHGWRSKLGLSHPRERLVELLG